MTPLLYPCVRKYVCIDFILVLDFRTSTMDQVIDHMLEMDKRWEDTEDNQTSRTGYRRNLR
mgnify:CR=1 FL=1